jgi:hypothetical protein
MKKSVILGALAVAGLAGAASAQTAGEGGTLAEVRERGQLNCGVNPGLTGFAAPNAEGVWEGFDVDLCRAISAAIFGTPDNVNYVPLSGETRFTALASGEVDLLARNSTWTFSRDTDLNLDFVGVNYYDGQGFMAPRALGVTSATELDGATVCIQSGTTTELNLADFFRVNNITYEPVPIANDAEGRQQYLAGALRRLHHGCLGPGLGADLLRGAGRPRDPARDHLQGASRAGRAPWRQRLGRPRALDLLHAGVRRGAGDHPGQRRRDGGGAGQQPGDQPSSGHRGRDGLHDGPRSRLGRETSSRPWATMARSSIGTSARAPRSASPAG